MDRNKLMFTEKVGSKRLQILNLPVTSHFSVKYFHDDILFGTIDSLIYFYCMSAQSILKKTKLSSNLTILNIETCKNFAHVNKSYSFCLLDLETFEEVRFKDGEIQPKPRIYKDLKGFEENGTHYFLLLKDGANEILLCSEKSKVCKLEEAESDYLVNEDIDIDMKMNQILASLAQFKGNVQSEDEVLDIDTIPKKQTRQFEHKLFVKETKQSEEISKQNTKEYRIQQNISIIYNNSKRQADLEKVKEYFQKALLSQKLLWNRQLQNVLNQKNQIIKNIQTENDSLKTENQELTSKYQNHLVEFKQKQDIKNQKLSESITTFIGQKDTIFKKQITKIKNEYSTKIENLNRVNHVLQQEVMSLQNQIEIKDLELEKLKTSVHEFDRVSRDLHTHKIRSRREKFFERKLRNLSKFPKSNIPNIKTLSTNCRGKSIT